MFNNDDDRLFQNLYKTEHQSQYFDIRRKSNPKFESFIKTLPKFTTDRQQFE